jgi:arylsulfatase A-like enzyme
VKNILLIIGDAVRARNTSVYDHEANTTPYLDSFSDRYTVFTQARAPSTWSLPSHTSMFTGYHVAEHGINAGNHALTEGHTIWEWLRDEHDYTTGVFSRNPYITAERYGLNCGFDTIRSHVSRKKYPFENGSNPDEAKQKSGRRLISTKEYLKHSLSHDHSLLSLLNGVLEKAGNVAPTLVPERLTPTMDSSAGVYTAEFLKWVTEREGQWAACINFVDAHEPYLPQPEFDTWGGPVAAEIYNSLSDHRWEFFSGKKPWWQRKVLESLYDGCIRQIDAAIESLISGLAERGELDETLVVITADHGEGFAERSRLFPDHRIVGHESGIHEVLLHVPLLVKHPYQEQSKQVSDIATLTQFPSAVKSVLADTAAPDAFVPDGPVIASVDTGARYAEKTGAIENYPEITSRESFSGEPRAVYEKSDGHVIKYCTWNNRSVSVEVRNAQESLTRDDNVRATVDDIFSGFDSVPIRETRDDEPDSDTYQRLKDLGYV